MHACAYLSTAFETNKLNLALHVGAYWQSFEKDHLLIVVDSHFTIKPTGDEYNQNRQKVMEAIYYAAKKSGVHLKATGWTFHALSEISM